MKDTNMVCLIGRLTRDVEVKALSNGTLAGRFSIAVNRWGKESQPSFIEVKEYGKELEAIQKYLVKGKRVAVTGELVQDRWDSDGKQKSLVYVLADNVQLLDGGEKRESQEALASKVFQDDIPW